MARKPIQRQSCVNKPTFKPIYRRKKKMNMSLAGLRTIRLDKKLWPRAWCLRPVHAALGKTSVTVFPYADLPSGQ